MKKVNAVIWSQTIDYKKALTDKVILITGAGRSGTTILGKITGSMNPAYYLFEPSIMKFIRHYTEADELRATIFEDYWLLQIQGRNINCNVIDDSYTGNYSFRFENRPLDRKKALERCLQSKLIIKLTEFQDRIKWFRCLFPGAKVVHIYRDGNDVITSMIKRGWYTDEYMETGFLDHTINKAPLFLNAQSMRNWQEYNQITRCACVWRCSVQAGLEEKDVVQLRYEDLAGTDFNLLADRMGLGITDLTRKHIKSIKEPTRYDSITGEIQQPERGRFMTLMGRLGYV